MEQADCLAEGFMRFITEHIDAMPAILANIVKQFLLTGIVGFGAWHLEASNVMSSPNILAIQYIQRGNIGNKTSLFAGRILKSQKYNASTVQSAAITPRTLTFRDARARWRENDAGGGVIALALSGDYPARP